MSIDLKTNFKTIYAWQCKLYDIKAKLKNTIETQAAILGVDESKSHFRYKVLQWDYNLPSNLWIISCQPNNPLIPCTDEHIERLLVVIDDAGKNGCSLNDMSFYFNGLYDPEKINQEIMLNIDSIIQFLLKWEILASVENKRKKRRQKILRQSSLYN